jgi:hypothetical protein
MQQHFVILNDQDLVQAEMLGTRPTASRWWQAFLREAEAEAECEMVFRLAELALDGGAARVLDRRLVPVPGPMASSV